MPSSSDEDELKPLAAYNKNQRVMKRPPPIYENTSDQSPQTPKRSCCSSNIEGITKRSQTVDEENLEEVSELHSELNAVNFRGFQKKVLSILFGLQEQNKKILQLLEQKTIQTSQEFEIPVEIPLKTEAGLEELEIFLNEKNNFQAFVKKISLFGARDISAAVYSILRHLITDEVAKNFSFYGKRGGKRPFHLLKLRASVVEAVQICIGSATNRSRNFKRYQNLAQTCPRSSKENNKK
ncbi:uncharacterized protein LOC123311012 [Coccinella septempunctata]|uniref:uncharacterized protein LOC123311012 n=1 Tax=Coccinella septempunctata TaxID=41139 RepID=UPI001D088B7F|nr:uncharacterized protein LOC123311012 [Coccinella septempunctata]